MSALCEIKRTTGDMANKSQRIGISFTLIQKAVKIPKINKRHPMKRVPIKESFERLALFWKR